MKSVIIYTRVSTKEQLEGSSLEVQEKGCRDYATRNELDVIRVFTEQGESAKTTDRPELKKMLEYIAKNHKELYAVLIHKIDRLSRVTYDYSNLKIFFSKYGIKLLSAMEVIEETPVGRYIETMLSSTAQFDNEVRGERSKNGMIEAVKNGRYVWPAPRGFINTGGRGKSNLAHGDTKIVELIHKFWIYVDTGCEVEEARRKIAEEGLKIPKGHAGEMLRNEIYKGVIRKFGLYVVGKFDPIIEPELFDRVLDKINGIKRKKYIYRVKNPDFPLRGIIKCDTCGEEFTGSWSTGNGGKYGYYRCNKCKKINYKKGDVETSFMDYIARYNYKPELKSALMQAITANLEERGKNDKKRITEIERKTLELKAKINQISDKCFKGVLSDNLARQMLSETEEEITNITLEKNQLESAEEDILEIAEKSIGILEDIGNIWLTLQIEIKIRFQKFLFPDGVYFDGLNFRTNQLALCIGQNWDIAPLKSPIVSPLYHRWNTCSRVY